MTQDSTPKPALPEGFAPPPERELKKARDYEQFTQGVVCWFNKTRIVRDRNIAGKEYTIHSFVTEDADDSFELFGSAALDAQLETVTQGSKVFLRYDGKQSQGAKQLHKWTVGVQERKQS